MHHVHRTVAARAAMLLVPAVLVTSGLAAPLVFVASAQEDRDRVLLSQGKPALGRTRESEAFPARDAVDGNPETRWSSRPADPQWLRVDLRQTADVSSVEIDWGTTYSTAYSIQLSADGRVWSTQWFTDDGHGGKDVITVPGEAVGRYVRMRSVTRSGEAGTSIRELRVYGRPEERSAVETPSSSAPSKPASSATPTASGPSAPTPSATPSPAPSRSGPPGAVLYYVVGKEPDGSVEKLNDIAARFLGDPNRYPEIADLTEGHRQPDGAFMTDPRTLRPGWALKMPKDASGAGLKFGILPGLESPSPEALRSPDLMRAVDDTGDVDGLSPVSLAAYAAGAVGVLAALTALGIWLARRWR